MKLLFITPLFFAIHFCCAQSQYEIIKDDNHPGQHLLKGVINKYLVQNDTTYKWYKDSHNSYAPDTATLNAFERTKEKVQFVVFGGTWCEDTQFILPKFFKLQEASAVADNRITLLGVNRDKKTLGYMSEAFAVTNVPTIIVMKEGKEIGRVVEYGKTGKWDKELAEILTSIN